MPGLNAAALQHIWLPTMEAGPSVNQAFWRLLLPLFGPFVAIGVGRGGGMNSGNVGSMEFNNSIHRPGLWESNRAEILEIYHFHAMSLLSI